MRLGEQRPRLQLLPAGDFSHELADEVIEWGEAVPRIFLDDWQKWLTRWALAEAVDGRWAAFEVCVILARQNGKNAWVRLMQLACVYVFGDQTIVHSAHELPTAAEHFRELRMILDPELNGGTTHPELAALLLPNGDSFMTANGKEQIRFRNGARILFRARTKTGGKGLTGDKIFLDEAFSLVGRELGSLVPTLTTKPMAQVFYTSSSPYASSNFLHGLRNRAKAPSPEDRRLFLAEWSNEPDVDPLDPAAWARSNPALGIRVTEEYIRDEYRLLSSDPDGMQEFLRERLGIPEGGEGVGGPIDVDQWRQLGDAGNILDDSLPHVLAVDVSPDRRWASVGAAGWQREGVGLVEVVKRDSGTAWVVPMLREAAAKRPNLKVVLDAGGPAGGLLADLIAAGITVDEVGVREHAQACGAFLDAVLEQRIRHRNQVALNDAVAGARQRQSQDVWLWSRAGSAVDISPLVAVTLAWGKLPAPQRQVWAFVG